MRKGTLVRPEKVMPLKCSESYSSKMLLDHTNSESRRTHINMGVLKAGTNLLPPSAHGKLGDAYDETYIMLKGSCKLELDGEVLNIQAGDIIFIPSGVYHGLDNTDGSEDVELLTIWAGVPPEGINSAYDLRLKEWGKSYRLIDDEI